MKRKTTKASKPTNDALVYLVRAEARKAALGECMRLREVILNEVRGMMRPTPDDHCITITAPGDNGDKSFLAGRWIVDEWSLQRLDGRLTLTLERAKP